MAKTRPKAKTPAKPRAKRSRGRPTKFGDEETTRQALIACRLGATDEDLAELFAVSERTIIRWRKKHTDFCHSVKKGKDLSNDNVVRSLYERACGYSHEAEKIFCQDGKIIRATYTEHYPPDTAAAFIWLKNRDPENWRDKQEIELGGDVEVSVEVTDADEDASKG